MKRLIKKIIRALLFLWCVCIFLIPIVNAEVPTGEYYSEFSTNKVKLLDFMTVATSVSLYGYNRSGYSPSLSSFLSGSTSLVRYENGTNDTYGNWAIRMYQSYHSVATYAMSWRVTFTDSSYAGQFCNTTASPSVTGGTVNSHTCSVSGTTAYLLINYDLTTADTGTSKFDFALTGGGLSINWFLRRASAVYYPQITVSEKFDTSGLESQNQIIINQNQTTISQNNTIIQQQQQTNEKIDDVNDTLNDSTVDSSDNTLNGISSSIASNNVISNLLLLPVTLFQSIVNSLSGTCSSFSLGSLLGTELVMPCIDLSNYLGSNLFNVIDILFSGMFVLVIRKKFVDIFNNMTNLRDRGNEVE